MHSLPQGQKDYRKNMMGEDSVTLNIFRARYAKLSKCKQ